MFGEIISFLVNIVTQVITFTSYGGVFFLMLLESCGLPIPSEVIMPFTGFLVAGGGMNFWLAVLAGTFGNLFGSLLAYYIGFKGGRPLIEKYGKYMLLSKHDLDSADKWFSGHGDSTVFIGRLMPIIRTYISFPAGIAKMNIKKFCFYTFIGALPWAALFAWLGMKLHNHWQVIHEKFNSFTLFFGILIIVLIILYIWRHLKNLKKNKSQL